jgi:hypothetical protein
VEYWLLISAVVLGGYGLTQAFGGHLNTKKRGRKILMLTSGLFAGWVACLYLNHYDLMGGMMHSFFVSMGIWIYLAFFSICGVVLGKFAYDYIWKRQYESRKNEMITKLRSENISQKTIRHESIASGG